MPLLLSFICGILLFFISRYFLYSSILIFLFSLAWLIRCKKITFALVIALGIVYAFIRLPVIDDNGLLHNRKIAVKGRFMPKSPAQPSPLLNFSPDHMEDAETGEEIILPDNEKLLLRSDFEFDPDDTYNLVIETEKEKRRLNPGSSGLSHLYGRIIEVRDNEEGRRLFGNIFERNRALLHEYIMGRYGRDSGDFIAAATIGEVHFEDDLRNAFNITGMAHILSISGTHFGLLSVVVFSIIIFLINRLPYSVLQRLTIYASPKQAAAIISLPVMIFYLAISGGSVPAVRSFIMTGLFLTGLLINRKGVWLNTVLLAAAVLLIWNPESVVSLSFQLSFLAVLFIGYSLEDGRSDPGPDGDIQRSNKIKDFLKKSIKMSLAATAGTAPLVAYHFHYLSIISPMANLVAAPLIGFIVIPLALLSSFSYILTGHYIFGPVVGFTTDFSLKIVRLMSKIPYADIRLPAFPPVLLILFYSGILLYAAGSRARRFLLLSIVPFVIYILLYTIQPAGMNVTFLDVGQGDSAVVEFPDNRVMVIDSGRTGHEAINYLKYRGRRDIDMLLITHSHPDHSGGAARLSRNFNLTELWDNGAVEYPEEFVMPSLHRRLERGDVFEGRGYSINILHPYQEFSTLEDNEFVEQNNSSVVLKLAGTRHTFLFSGDIETEAEEDIKHLEKWIKSDVLKVPHHGGRSSAHKGLLDQVSPSIAVISAGRNNTFGHPSIEMLRLLSDSRVFRTDRDGAVKITETGGGLKVRTYRDYAFEKTGSFGSEINNLSRLFHVW